MTDSLEDRLRAAAESRDQPPVDPSGLRASAGRRRRRRRLAFGSTLVATIALGFAVLRVAALNSPSLVTAATEPLGIGDSETGPAVHGAPVFNLGASVITYLDIRAREEAATQACMNGKGFAYEPAIPDLWVASDEIGGAFVTEMGDDEFAAAFGFAVAIGNGGDFIDLEPERAAELSAAARDAERQALDLAVADIVDEPPDDLRPANPSEGSDYEAALYGHLLLGALGLDEGCHGEVTPLRSSWNDRWEIETIEAVDAAKRSLANDPELIAYYNSWSRCMAAEGHQATSPLAIQIDLEERFLVLWRGQPTEDSQSELTTEEQQLAISTVACGESVTKLLPSDLWPLWERHGGHLPT